MKSRRTITLAIWFLEHLTFGSDREALCGDLLEHFQGGRSASWLWREVIIAIGIGVFRKLSRYALPLAFSMTWSILYPVWVQFESSRFLGGTIDYSEAIPWPLSSFAHLAHNIFPVISFVWLGLFAFILLRRDILSQISAFQILQSLSCSHCVFLLSLIFFRKHSPCSVWLLCIAEPGFHFFAINVPLAVSLFVGIYCVLPPEQQPPRRRRRAQSFKRTKWLQGLIRPA